jgi:hypothetical protein
VSKFLLDFVRLDPTVRGKAAMMDLLSHRTAFTLKTQMLFLGFDIFLFREKRRYDLLRTSTLSIHAGGDSHKTIGDMELPIVLGVVPDRDRLPPTRDAQHDGSSCARF